MTVQTLNGAWTSRALVAAALSGREVPRTPCGPLAVHFCATLGGASLREFTLDARLLADCVAGYYEQFRPDAVWISADTWVTAEAMGAPVYFPDENQPMGGRGGPLVQSPADIDKIPPADPSAQGRMPLMIEALGRVRQALGDEVFIVSCFDQSPFSLACAVAGIENVMVNLIEDAPFVEALLERCVEYTTAYGAALAGHGADMLSTGDSPAALIGPELYREVALPAERRVFGRLKELAREHLSLHICGDTRHILEDMATSGADVLELDSAVPINEACARVPENVAIWGNLDPVAMLMQGSPEEVAAEARGTIEAVRGRGRTRYVLSSGCTLATCTPAENLRALIAAANH